MSVTTATSKELLGRPVLKSAISKAARRLMPMLVILYVVSFLDRTNVGFAEAALGADKGVSAGAFALGAGIFFIGYAIFEIPSNLLLKKVGAKIWLARIAITWGIVSACFAFVQGETSFVILRFLLGVTEAGPEFQGTIKSATAFGILLAEGIGDTIRVSITGDPIEEVKAAQRILASLELRRFETNVIACPSCGRCEIDVIGIANQVRART